MHIERCASRVREDYRCGRVNAMVSMSLLDPVRRWYMALLELILTKHQKIAWTHLSSMRLPEKWWSLRGFRIFRVQNRAKREFQCVYESSLFEVCVPLQLFHEGGCGCVPDRVYQVDTRSIHAFLTSQPAGYEQALSGHTTNFLRLLANKKLCTP